MSGYKNIHIYKKEGIGNSGRVAGQKPRKFWRGEGLNGH